MKIVPIIPSLNPDYKLERLVDELIENDFKKIIVVNDGSSDNSIFDKLDKKEECIILTHEVNRGKGSLFTGLLGNIPFPHSYFKHKVIHFVIPGFSAR